MESQIYEIPKSSTKLNFAMSTANVQRLEVFPTRKIQHTNYRTTFFFFC
jgi:hypothetical protein